MAQFGAKVKLSVDTSNQNSFQEEIQNAVSKASPEIKKLKISDKCSIETSSLQTALKKACENLTISPKLKVEFSQKDIKIDPKSLQDSLNTAANLKLTISQIDISKATERVKSELDKLFAEYDGKITDITTKKGGTGKDGTPESKATEASVKKALDNLKEVRTEVNKSLTQAETRAGRDITGDVKKIESLSAAYDELQKNLEAFKKSQENGTTPPKNLDTIQKEAQEASKELEKLKTKLDKLSTSGDIAVKKQINQVYTTLSNVNNPDMLKRGLDIIKKAQAGFGTPDGYENLTELSDKVLKFKNDCEQSGASVKSFGQKIKEAFTQKIGYGVMAAAANYVRQAFRQTITETSALNKELIDLQIVSNSTATAMTSVGKRALSIGKEIGASATDVVNAATVFARLGFSLDESLDLSKYTTIFSKLAAVDMSDAEDAITAVVKSFDVDTSQLDSLLSKMTYVGNNFPISASQLGEGMTNAASALSAAGNSYEQSLALLTGANITVQNAAKSSTALRTITARIRNTSAELEELGETMDSSISTIPKYRAKLLELSGVDILESDGETFRSTYDILDDLSAKWDSLSDTAQAAITDMVAGVRQQNVFSSIMLNFDEVRQVMDEMDEAEGTLARGQDIYTSGVEAKANTLKATFQEFSTGFMTSDFLGNVYDVASKLVEVFNFLINGFGGLATKATAFAATAALLSSAFGGISKAISNFKANNGAIANTFAAIQLGIEGASKAAKNGKSKIAGFFSGITGASKTGSLVSAALGVAGIVASVTTAIISAIKQAKEEARQAAIESAEELSSLTSESEKYTEQISSLKEKLNSGDLTQEEAVSTRKELLEIQSQVIEAYGLEADAIDVLGDSATTTAQKLEEMNKVRHANWLAENKSAIEEARNQMENYSFNWGGSLGAADSEMSKQVQNLIDRYTTISFSPADQYGTYSGIEIKSDNIKTASENIQNLISDLTNLRTTLKNSGYSDGQINNLDYLISSLATESTRVQGVISTFATTYEQAIESELVTNTDYSVLAAKINDAQEAAAKAAEDNTPEAVAAAKEAVQDVYNAMDDVEWDDDNIGVKNYVDTLAQGIQDSVDSSDTKVKLNDFLNLDPNDAEYEGSLKHMADKALKVFKDEAGNLDATNIKNIIEALSSGNTDGLVIPDGAMESWFTLRQTANLLGVDINELIDGMVGFSSASKTATTSFRSIEIISSRVNDYQNALSAANDVLSNNTQITEENYQALQQYIGGYDEFSSAIDTSNGYIVTNAELLKQLIDIESTYQANLVKASKSQLQLEYIDLSAVVNELIDSYARAGKSVDDLTDSEKTQIETLWDQMSALEQTIAKYSLYEQRLLGATNAFTKFEEAQQTDSENDYISDVEDMVTALDNIFSDELGANTETAKAAIEGLVPESVYKDLATVDEKIAAIYKYFDDDLSLYFDIEYDDDGVVKSVEATSESARKFIEKGLKEEVGVFVGEDWQHFDLAPDIESLDQLAEKMGVTKEVAFSMIQFIEDHDIEWLNGDYTSIFDKFDSAEDNIYKTANAMDTLNKQYYNAEISADEYFKKSGELQKQQKENISAARENANAYLENENNIANLQSQLESYTASYNKAVNAGDTKTAKSWLNFIEKVQEKLGIALETREELEVPGEMSLKLVLDDIDTELDSWRARHPEWFGEDGGLSTEIHFTVPDSTNGSAVDVVVNPVFEDGEWKLPELDNEVKLALEKTQEWEEIQKVLELLNESGQIEAQLNVDSADKAKDDMTQLLETTEQLNTILQNLYAAVDTRAAVKALDRLIAKYDNKSITIKTKVNTVSVPLRDTSNPASGGIYLHGTAHGSGDWGLKTREHNSLVGELGAETVVDPETGRYYTVGDNGAELVDLPKGAIIFNHKQTEQLFKYGRINSRGNAYAEGNAHLTYLYNGKNRLTSKKTSSSKSDTSVNVTVDTSNLEEQLEEQLAELKEKLDDLLGVYEHKIFMLEKHNAETSEIVAVYKQMQKEVHAQAEKYREMGLSEESEYIREMQQAWWEYYDAITDRMTEYYDDLVKNYENTIMLTENWINKAVNNWDYDSLRKYTDDTIAYYKEMQQIIHEQAEYYRSIGYSDTSDEISKLSDLWKQTTTYIRKEYRAA